MTSPYPLPPLPRAPPVRFIPSKTSLNGLQRKEPRKEPLSNDNSNEEPSNDDPNNLNSTPEYQTLIDSFANGNYPFCIKAGLYYISQNPLLPPTVLSAVLELVGDSQYSLGLYSDSMRTYGKVTTPWCVYKKGLAGVMEVVDSTTGGYGAEELGDVVKEMEGLGRGDIGDVQWNTLVGLRRAVLQDYSDELITTGTVGFTASTITGSAHPGAGLEGEWYAGAVAVDMKDVTVDGMDEEAYDIFRLGKGEDFAQSLHTISSAAMNMTPSSHVPYNCMSIWLLSQLPSPHLYPYFECLGRDFQYTNPVCPDLPKVPELTEEQGGWAELALNVVDKSLEIRTSTIGFLVKGQLLEIIGKSGEKFFRKALATTGYGSVPVSSPLLCSIMESLVYSLLGNSPRYALQTAKQYMGKVKGGGKVAHANFLVGLCWVRGGDWKKGLEHLNKSLALFDKSGEDEWSRWSAGKAAGVTVQTLLATGDYASAREILTHCESKGWGSEIFVRVKLGIVLACCDLKDEALVAFHTAIGLGAGVEAEEGIEKLERLMRGYGEEGSDGDVAEYE